MKLEKGIISNFQLLFMVMAFMQSLVLTVDFCFSFTKQNTWIVVPAAFVITLLIARMYIAISKKYPEKNLIQINDSVFGVYFGRLISVLYAWFFFQLVIHYLYFFNSFWINYIMPEIPRFVIIIVFCMVCAFAVRKGLEVIARCCFLITAIVGMTTLTLTILLSGNMEASYLFPLLEAPLKDIVQSTHIMLTIPFCEIVVFLMIFPYTSDKQKLKKPFLLGICLSAIQLLIVVVRNILVLGPLGVTASSVSFAVAREIDIADILTRLDILFAVNLIISFFIKVTVLYYATVLSTAQILNLRSYKPLVIPIGVLSSISSIMLFPSDMEQNYVAKYVWPFSASIFEFFLPAMTILVIAIRSIVVKMKETEA